MNAAVVPRLAVLLAVAAAIAAIVADTGPPWP